MTTAAAFVPPATRSGQIAWLVERATGRWSLARQYLVASLLVVVVGVVITGAWIGHQIETSVLERTAGITALYVDSVLGPNLQALAQDDRWLSPVDTAALDRLVSQTRLGQGVVLFKIWSLDGRILYCPNPQLVGQQFPIDSGLARAAQGEVTADMSDLVEPENTYEHQLYRRLVEVYAPVREDSGGRVIAVNEFYLLPDALEADIRDAQLRSWAVVAGIGLATYLLLAGIVKRGSDTIRRQQAQLQHRLDQNEVLHQRVRQAAGRTTALNEQALRRISADLHDGPAQALALALLRLDGLQEPCADPADCGRTSADFSTVHGAVRDALAEVRAISAGLRLPELEPLSVAAVAERAIADHQRRWHPRGPTPEQSARAGAAANQDRAAAHAPGGSVERDAARRRARRGGSAGMRRRLVTTRGLRPRAVVSSPARSRARVILDWRVCANGRSCWAAASRSTLHLARARRSA